MPDPRRVEAVSGAHLELSSTRLHDREVRVAGAKQRGRSGEHRIEEVGRRAAAEHGTGRLIEGRDERVLRRRPASIALHGIESSVRHLDERVLRRPILRQTRDADADRDDRPGALIVQTVDRGTDTPGRFIGSGGSRSGQDDRELISAVPIRCVASPDGCLDGPRNRSEKRVSGRVAERVVVGLEAIQVHHQDR